MATINDIDSLLGDLERACNNKSKSNNHSLDNSISGKKQHQGVGELDELLQDLSKARYSTGDSNYDVPVGSSMGFQLPKKKETDIVIREMEKSDKMQERRFFDNNGKVSQDGPDLDSKWEYKGYGIWENSEHANGTMQINERHTEVIKTTTTTTSHATVSASSATQELDELMKSLNTFKIKDDKAQASDEPDKNNLDDMLGNLQQDMDKQGIKTTAKGMCHACEKPIVGQVVTAVGKTWHPEHFMCNHCKTELGTRSFFERDGRCYCEEDYHKLFSPRCGKCQEAILDRCVSALDQTFHPDCFVCKKCDEKFGDDGFHEMEADAFCKTCFFKLFAPKCGGCNEAITENYVSSLDQQWHPTCFVCSECKEPFSGGNFFEHGGRPYCETHYHAKRGSLCSGCQKPISGRCITAMFKKFHPEHFVCSFCLKQLNKGTFKENKDKPYCHDCHDRLFG